MSHQGGGYTFTSNPRPLYRKGENDSSLYRDPSLADTRPANIMFDARVVRGIAHGKPVVTSTSKHIAALDAIQSTVNAKREMRNERRQRDAEKTQMINDGLIRPTLKSVHEMHRSIVIPKKRTELKLSLYLEETQETKLVTVQEIQTDKLATPPATPPYKPRKVGHDVYSQVDVSEIFNFDEAVAPIVELLLGHSFEQALSEVTYEGTTEALVSEQKRLEQEEAARLAAEKTLVEEEARRAVQASRQLQQARDKEKKEARVRAMLAAQRVAADLMCVLQREVNRDLVVHGVVQDTFEAAVEHDFMPWLVERVHAHVAARNSVGELVEKMIQEGLSALGENAKATKAARASAEVKAEEERVQAEAARALELKMNTPVDAYVECQGWDGPLGPLKLRGGSRVVDLETRVLEWLATHMEDISRVPSPDKLRFEYNGVVLGRMLRLYEVGIEALANITLVIEHEEEEEREEGEGEGEGEEEGEEEEKEEDDGYVVAEEEEDEVIDEEEEEEE